MVGLFVVAAADLAAVRTLPFRSPATGAVLLA
jgi:hypothetical protein